MLRESIGAILNISIRFEESLKGFSSTTLNDRRLRWFNWDVDEQKRKHWLGKTAKSNKKTWINQDVSVRGNSLSICRESLISRIGSSFCVWAKVRDKFFLNRVVQTWNSLTISIVVSPSLNYFKSVLKKCDDYLINTQQYR